jgi:hypothetical protein
LLRAPGRGQGVLEWAFRLVPAACAAIAPVLAYGAGYEVAALVILLPLLFPLAAAFLPIQPYSSGLPGSAVWSCRVVGFLLLSLLCGTGLFLASSDWVLVAPLAISAGVATRLLVSQHLAPESASFGVAGRAMLVAAGLCLIVGLVGTVDLYSKANTSELELTHREFKEGPSRLRPGLGEQPDRFLVYMTDLHTGKSETVDSRALYDLMADGRVRRAEVTRSHMLNAVTSLVIEEDEWAVRWDTSQGSAVSFLLIFSFLAAGVGLALMLSAEPLQRAYIRSAEKTWAEREAAARKK